MGITSLTLMAGSFSVVVLLAVGVTIAWAALSESQVLSLIERAKILSSDAQVQARVGSRDVAISAYRHPKATDKDCKIDAVLLAKVVMDADPAGITTVKIRFYDPTNNTSYREIDVGSGVVKAFGEGRLSKDELLSSVVIERGDQDITRYRNRPSSGTTQSAEVAAGIYKSERMNLLSRIQLLRDKGVGVRDFLGKFFNIEDKVRQADEVGLAHDIELLNEQIGQQEETTNQARSRRPALEPRADRTHDGMSSGVSSQRGNWGPAGQMQGGFDAPRGLGDLKPTEGPALPRRYRIARTILDLESQGSSVLEYRDAYHELQNLAMQGPKAPGFWEKLKYLEQRLGLQY
ncbi:MAG: hypothetical protein HY711_00195 [Candidatus Melainabacteria bacterium]|nr:hypothetical protein [Candidatus Melainabacteria bacterium]